MNRRLAIWPTLALAVVLLWPFPFVAAIHPPNELTRLYQARAIVVDHTLAIDGELARHGALFDLSRYRGRTYPSRAPGMSLIGAGVLLAYGAVTGRPVATQTVSESLWILEKVLLVLPTLVLFVLLRRTLLRFSDNRWAVEAAALAWALGSAALPYGLLFYGHGLTAALLFGGFLAYDRARAGRGGWIALGGFLHGAAILVEYTVAPAALVLALWPLADGLRRRSGRARAVFGRALLGLVGAAAPIAVLLWYHDVAFGSPFSTAYQHLAVKAVQKIHSSGFMGLHLPRPDWLARSLFEPGRGLVWFSPWVVLAAFGFVPAWRRRRWETSAALGVTIVYLVFSMIWDPGTWGWVVGPRHLVPLLPFLALPAAAALSWLRDRPGVRGPRLAGLAAGTILAPVAVHVLSVVVYPHYPPELENPIVQLALPLLAKGFTVDDVGKWLLGRAEPYTVLPVVLAALGWTLAVALLAFGRASPRGRLAALGAALGAALLCLVVTWGAGAIDARALVGRERTRTWVEAHYWPEPGARVGPPWDRALAPIR